MESNINTNTNTSPLDQRLSALMLRGWTLLADVCPIEVCQCPLMRLSNNNKSYCPNCEAWVVNDEIQSKMSFNELVNNVKVNKRPMQAKQIRKEVIEISKEKGLEQCQSKPALRNNYSNIHDEDIHDKVKQTLKDKLNQLTERLRTESDSTKIKWLLQNINLCIKNIKELNELNYNDNDKQG